jgi:hypothetical protein
VDDGFDARAEDLGDLVHPVDERVDRDGRVEGTLGGGSPAGPRPKSGPRSRSDVSTWASVASIVAY